MKKLMILLMVVVWAIPEIIYMAQTGEGSMMGIGLMEDLVGEDY